MSVLLKRIKKKNKHKISEKEKQDTIVNDKLSIVIGANSPLGIFLVNELLVRGRRVRLVVSNDKKTRELFPEEDIEIFKANLRNITSITNAIEKDAIVYHCVKIPTHRWFRDFPIFHFNIIRAVTKHEAKLVYVDNLSVYGRMKGSKISEKDPLNPNSDEGKMRIELANQVIIGVQRGVFKATIVRFPDLYGPCVINDFTKNVFERPLKNLPAKWYINTNQPHSLIYIKDAAKALVNIAEYEEDNRQIWHVAGPQAITGSQFIKIIYRVLNKDLKIESQSKIRIKILSFFNSDLGRVKDLIDQWEYPFEIDGTKYKRIFKNSISTPHEEAIIETLEWFKKRIKEQESYKKYYSFGNYQSLRC
jgi:nucleoside-diphosphate-sugar epimerase